MKRQRNYSQWKEQEKSPERTDNETELTNLQDPKFKEVVIKILTELRNIIYRNEDHCNKEQETIKMNQSKINNSVAKIKTNLEAMNSWLNKTEERISNLKDGIMEITQSEQQTERQMKKKKKQHIKSMG